MDLEQVETFLKAKGYLKTLKILQSESKEIVPRTLTR
jgi:hypothetical protein